MLVCSSKTITAAVPSPRQPAFTGALKSSGVSNSFSVRKPMLSPPGMQPLALRFFQTPPPYLSTNSRTVMPSGASFHDVGDARQRLDVVHDRRLAKRSFDGRERRLDPGPGAFAFQALDQAG